jgi:hypothetical protein
VLTWPTASLHAKIERAQVAREARRALREGESHSVADVKVTHRLDS